MEVGYFRSSPEDFHKGYYQNVSHCCCVLNTGNRIVTVKRSVQWQKWSCCVRIENSSTWHRIYKDLVWLNILQQLLENLFFLTCYTINLQGAQESLTSKIERSQCKYSISYTGLEAVENVHSVWVNIQETRTTYQRFSPWLSTNQMIVCVF